MPCGLVDVYRSFGGTSFSIYHQNTAIFTIIFVRTLKLQSKQKLLTISSALNNAEENHIPLPFLVASFWEEECMLTRVSRNVCWAVSVQFILKKIHANNVRFRHNYIFSLGALLYFVFLHTRAVTRVSWAYKTKILSKFRYCSKHVQLHKRKQALRRAILLVLLGSSLWP